MALLLAGLVKSARSVDLDVQENIRGRFGCEEHLLFALPCTRCQAGYVHSTPLSMHYLASYLFACMVSFRSSNAPRARGVRQDATKSFFACTCTLLYPDPRLYYSISIKNLHCATSLVQVE